MAQKRLVIAGGGTGGHLYPAIAIARALLEKAPDWEVHFVGAAGGLEEKIIPREKFPLHLIPIGKLHRSVGMLARLRTVLGLPWAAIKTFLLVKRLKPTVVLGVGGFASGPFLFVASRMRIPCALWEPNAYPGLANRLLAPSMQKCLVVFKEAERHMRGKNFIEVGLPVRSSMRPGVLEERDDKFHLLVFGGSQGARAINQVLVKAVSEGGSWLDHVSIVHQTGKADFATVNDAYLGFAPKIQAFEFLHDMEKRYHWADLVICRAGASTVAEICAIQKPAVFVPLPTASDNHQQKNAEVLARAGAAHMVIQKEFTAAYLKKLVEQYKSEPTRLDQMVEKLSAFQYPKAAETIALELLAMAPGSGSKV